MNFEFMKNIAVNLRATGPAAVLIALIAGITILGLFGDGPMAKSALSILALLTGLVGISLAQRT